MSTKQRNILLVGAFSDNPSIYTYATSFLNSLNKLHYNIATFNYRASFMPYAAHLGTFGSTLNAYRCNYELIKIADNFEPAILFLIKAENITAQTLHTIKRRHNCTIINFYPDNPFTLWNGNSTADVLQRLPLCNCFLSWSQTLIPQIQAAGCNHACHFPFAYDEDIFLSQEKPQQPTYTSDICFVGTWEPTREEWLAHLHRSVPYSLAIWGNDWYEHCHDNQLKKCIRGNAVYNDTMVAIIRSSKIVLNFIREQNMNSHNMRTFEVPASGAFLLTQRTFEQAKLYFKEGESIECFSTPQELVEKITFYLQHESHRLNIAHNGFVCAQDFTLTKQLRNYFDVCPSFTSKG